MNDNGYWPEAMRVNGRSASHGARRTTAQIAKEGTDGSRGVVSDVCRGEYMRRAGPAGVQCTPMCPLQTPHSIALRAGALNPSQRRLAGECRCFLGHCSAITSAPYGSLGAGPGARWRRHPNSRQQSSLPRRLTGLTDSPAVDSVLQAPSQIRNWSRLQPCLFCRPRFDDSSWAADSVLRGVRECRRHESKAAGLLAPTGASQAEARTAQRQFDAWEVSPQAYSAFMRAAIVSCPISRRTVGNRQILGWSR